MRVSVTPTMSIVGLVALFALSATTPVTEAYNILGIFPSMSRSHHICGSALMKGLAAAGHNVTVISPFPLAKPVPNYRDIAVLGIEELMAATMPNILEMSDRSALQMQNDQHTLGFIISNHTLRHPLVQRLLADRTEHFDVVLLEVFLNEAMLGFGHHFDAPVIGYSTFGASMWTTAMVGSPSPLSYVPHAFLSFTDRMTFGQRVANTLMTLVEAYTFRWHLAVQEDFYQELFPRRNKPSMEALRRNVSLVLLNTHHSLGTPRPYVPNMIEIGGVHINRRAQRQPLPADVQRFVDGADPRHGVVYFSMGSNIRSAALPAEMRAGILRALAALPQRVLWKFEDAQLPGRPDNVLIRPWFPQDDVLAHPAVRLFITHGGLLSTTEAVYHGVPLVGIPVFGDQSLNMGRAEAGGFGRMVAFKNVSAESLGWALATVLNDPAYAERAKLAQQRYRDQPMQPMEVGVYWVEYVARHRGAAHLHCAGQDLGWFVYHGVDVWATLAAVVAALVVAVWWACGVCLRCVWAGNKRGVASQKKRN